MEIAFDPAKSADTVERRGSGFDIVAGFDRASAVCAVDDRRDDGEVRGIALGSIGGATYVVVFMRRAAALHIISVRRADRKERDRDAQD